MAPIAALTFKEPLRAFTKTGLDFAGPFITKQRRGNKRTKRYLFLFTCLLCGAVHLEMACGMDTNSFLNAFYRKVNRRGLQLKVLSDNETNIVGENTELKELINKLEKDEIKRSTAKKGIKWHFNALLGPHLGSDFETMIRASKQAVSNIFGVQISQMKNFTQR